MAAGARGVWRGGCNGAVVVCERRPWQAIERSHRVSAAAVGGWKHRTWLPWRAGDHRGWWTVAPGCGCGGRRGGRPGQGCRGGGRAAAPGRGCCRGRSTNVATASLPLPSLSLLPFGAAASRSCSGGHRLRVTAVAAGARGGWLATALDGAAVADGRRRRRRAIRRSHQAATVACTGRGCRREGGGERGRP